MAKGLALGGVLFFLWAAYAQAGPVDLSAPPNTLGASDPFGYLSIWRETGEVDFGHGLALPVRIQFSSERETASPYLGQGWWLPLLEARAYLKRPEMMYATLLCGKSMYLRRSHENENQFYSMDKQWTGVLDGDKFTISRTDGWELRYRQGHLYQLRTDTGRVITWVANKDGVVTALQEEGTTNIPLTISFTDEGVPNGLVVNGKRYSFALDKKPHVIEVQGQRLIGSLDPSLSTWNFPDGKAEHFQFAVDTDTMTPNLDVTGIDKNATHYTWDPKSRHIASEGPWKYKISPAQNPLDPPVLKRINDNGKDEFVAVRPRDGITEVKTADGRHTVTYMYTATGPLYNLVHKVEKIDGGGKHSTIYEAAYNETGALVREMGADGWTRAYKYDKNRNIVTTTWVDSRTPEVLARLAAKEKILLSAVIGARLKNQVAVDETAQDLCFFYIHEMRDCAKGLDFAVANIKSPKLLFNVKMQAINDNINLSPSQKLEAYKPLLLQFPKYKVFIENLITIEKTKDSKEAGL